MKTGRYTIEAINRMTAADFSAAFGQVYEHSPWIAERAFARRPFSSRLDVQLALYAVVQSASRAERVALLGAHPELAGQEAQAGTMTAESVGEQASARLDALPPDQVARLAELNLAYRRKFGFPAIIAVRLNSRAAIFHAFEGRLHNDVEQEVQNGIAQVCEIARLRLADLLADDAPPAPPAPPEPAGAGRQR
jgi:2-oxo-4-hydroxy-4-carboxy-5-ureidoimidazoline decarboxylase